MSKSATLLRTARQRAGLTQAELAARAGVTQSVISAYENDRREPSLSVLDRLVGATGTSLMIGLAGSEQHKSAGGNLPPRLPGLRARAEELRSITREHGAELVGVFGSVARGEDSAESDIDLLITGVSLSLFSLLGLERALETALDAKVDVIPIDGLRASVRAEADRDLVRL